MPEKIITADGSEREVPTADELKEFQTAKEERDRLANENKTLAEKQKELEESANPDWRNIRQQLKHKENLETALKEGGFELDAAGKLVQKTTQQPLTAEQIKQLSVEAAANTTISMWEEDAKEAAFKGLDKDTRSAAEFLFNKLSSGEKKTKESISGWLKLARQGAAPEGQQMTGRGAPDINGGVPRYKDGQTFSDSTEGAKLAENLFGNESFTKAKK